MNESPYSPDENIPYIKNNLRFFPGVLSHKAVREKIVRAFLIEEQKIVMKVLKAQGKADK